MTTLRSLLYLVALGFLALLGLKLFFGVAGFLVAILFWTLPLAFVGLVAWWMWGKVAPTSRERVASELGMSPSPLSEV